MEMERSQGMKKAEDEADGMKRQRTKETQG